MLVVVENWQPDNLFFSPDAVKLLDFGLVKKQNTREGGQRLTSDEQLLGTPLYMSPEAYTDPATVDTRADLFALGAVTYFLLVGEPTFKGKTAVEVGAHICTRPQSRLRSALTFRSPNPSPP